MESEFANDIIQEGIKVALMIASPMLIGALLIGILVSVFQAVTQINEQTLTFIPKILIIAVALIIFAPWMTDVLTNYTRDIIISIPKVVLAR
jgi:flagellar biosynthesis protein FliQ